MMDVSFLLSNYDSSMLTLIDAVVSAIERQIQNHGSDSLPIDPWELIYPICQLHGVGANLSYIVGRDHGYQGQQPYASRAA